jgi:hypothetical protein
MKDIASPQPPAEKPPITVNELQITGNRRLTEIVLISIASSTFMLSSLFLCNIIPSISEHITEIAAAAKIYVCIWPPGFFLSKKYFLNQSSTKKQYMSTYTIRYKR